MSRSYRKQPFQSICGTKSAKKDKQLAARGVRRSQDRALRQALETNSLEDLVLPAKLECPWNNNYSWVRDGSQRYCGLTARDRYRYENPNEYGWNYYANWPPDWYVKMMRK